MTIREVYRSILHCADVVERVDQEAPGPLKGEMFSGYVRRLLADLNQVAGEVRARLPSEYPSRSRGRHHAELNVPWRLALDLLAARDSIGATGAEIREVCGAPAGVVIAQIRAAGYMVERDGGTRHCVYRIRGL